MKQDLYCSTANSCGFTHAIIVSPPFSSDPNPSDFLSTRNTILMGRSTVDIVAVPPIMQMPSGNSSSYDIDGSAFESTGQTIRTPFLAPVDSHPQKGSSSQVQPTFHDDWQMDRDIPVSTPSSTNRVSNRSSLNRHSSELPNHFFRRFDTIWYNPSRTLVGNIYPSKARY